MYEIEERPIYEFDEPVDMWGHTSTALGYDGLQHAVNGALRHGRRVRVNGIEVTSPMPTVKQRQKCEKGMTLVVNGNDYELLANYDRG